MTAAVARVAECLRGVKHVVLVLSGKGGVGKSTVATLLALSLSAQGQRVGLLDVDLCGPSIPTMVGLKGQRVHQGSSGWVPVYTGADQRLAVMSIGFLVDNQDASVVWRGPKKTGASGVFHAPSVSNKMRIISAMIRQFLTDVAWGELDYLIVDTPPGTSDEHIALVEYLQDLNPDGAVVVTTPQVISFECARVCTDPPLGCRVGRRPEGASVLPGRQAAYPWNRRKYERFHLSSLHRTRVV